MVSGRWQEGRAPQRGHVPVQATEAEAPSEGLALPSRVSWPLEHRSQHSGSSWFSAGTVSTWARSPCVGAPLASIL